MEGKSISPVMQLMGHVMSKWINKPLFVAAELGIADILAKGPKSVTELAEQTGTHERTLYRILRALISVGIFTETEDKKIALNEVAALLQTGILRAHARMFLSEWYSKPWENLMYSVKTGKSAFEKTYGQTLFDWIKDKPEEAKIFGDVMSAYMKTGKIEALISAYDFSKANTLIDVGGGHGLLVLEILGANPSLKGTVFDLQVNAEEAGKLIEEKAMGDRCSFVGGDFFQSVPEGFDLYLLSHVIHDWGDEKALQILTQCRNAVGKDGKLLLVEYIVPSEAGPSHAKLFDMEMLVLTAEGCERTEDEFKNLFEKTGFELSKTTPLKDGLFLIEGIPV